MMPIYKNVIAFKEWKMTTTQTKAAGLRVSAYICMHAVQTIVLPSTGREVDYIYNGTTYTYNNYDDRFYIINIPHWFSMHNNKVKFSMC